MDIYLSIYVHIYVYVCLFLFLNHLANACCHIVDFQQMLQKSGEECSETNEGQVSRPLSTSFSCGDNSGNSAQDLSSFTLSYQTSKRKLCLKKCLDQTFQEEVIPILYNLSQKIEAEEILPDSFNEVNIILISKPDKDVAKKTIDQYFL